jgi:hypothetical protein
MKYKEGDTVRIESTEYFLDQEEQGRRIIGSSELNFTKGMYKYTGKLAKIFLVDDIRYRLDVDNGENWWEDWMFDPDYNGGEPLSAEDAIRAMLDGETLYTEDGYKYRFNKKCGGITRLDKGNYITDIQKYKNLYRRAAGRKRTMTRLEALAWAGSEASHGWVVRSEPGIEWCLPQRFSYGTDTTGYQRARLLPDGSGIDEESICGFEVEE